MFCHFFLSVPDVFDTSDDDDILVPDHGSSTDESGGIKSLEDLPLVTK